MFNLFQIITLPLLMFLVTYDSNNTQIAIYGKAIFCGFLSGLINGDVVTGLSIGATLELMSLGVGSYGGASVPNYNIGATVGTAFAVATGGGLEAGLAIGIPTAALGVQLDVLGKMAGSFFLHRAQAAAEELDTKKMYRWLLAGSIPRPFMFAITTLIAVTAGAGAIEWLLANMPSWLISGLSVAGNVLPAVGIAILLRYMPFKKYYVYVLAGFILASYLGLSMIAIAVIGFIAAVLTFQNNQKFDALSARNATVAVEEGDQYDE